MTDLITDVVALTCGIIIMIQLVIVLIVNCFVINYSDRILITKWFIISIMVSITTILFTNGLIEVIVMNNLTLTPLTE